MKGTWSAQALDTSPGATGLLLRSALRGKGNLFCIAMRSAARCKRTLLDFFLSLDIWTVAQLTSSKEARNSHYSTQVGMKDCLD